MKSYDFLAVLAAVAFVAYCAAAAVLFGVLA